MFINFLEFVVFAYADTKVAAIQLALDYKLRDNGFKSYCITYYMLFFF